MPFRFKDYFLEFSHNSFYVIIVTLPNNAEIQFADEEHTLGVVYLPQRA